MILPPPTQSPWSGGSSEKFVFVYAPVPAVRSSKWFKPWNPLMSSEPVPTTDWPAGVGTPDDGTLAALLPLFGTFSSTWSSGTSVDSGPVAVVVPLDVASVPAPPAMSGVVPDPPARAAP